MKRLVLLAGATLVMSSAAHAQDTEVKHNGDFRVRYYNDMTPSGVKDQPGNKSDIEGRMKLGLTMRKGENLQAHVTLLHGTIFGQDKAASTTLAGSGYSTVNNDNGLLVNQAYGWWKAGESVTLKAGRFNVEIGGGEFFSADDWRLVPITHEGFQVGFDTGFAMFNAYLIKDKELTPKNPASLDSDPEQHNVILTADLKNMPEAIKTANITAVQISRSETGTAGSANAQHIGLTVGGEVAGFSYKGVYATQMGIESSKVGTPARERKLAGNMFDLMVGYAMPETMGLKLYAGYHMDSGDDCSATAPAVCSENKAYQPLYYSSHKYGGMMDMFGWGNLSYFNLGASVAPSEDLEVGLGFFMFTKTQERGAVSTNANTRATYAGLANKSDLGMELDVYASKKYSSAFSIDAHLGAFMPGAAFKDATAKKEATIMQLMVAGTMMF